MKFKFFDDDLRYNIIREILNVIIEKKDRILDVGCGEGKLTLPYNKIYDIVGVDINLRSLVKAKWNGLYCLLCDIEKTYLPFQDESFDIVICSEVLEHVVHTDHLLQEINRVLRMGGTFILSFPNINNLSSIFLQLFFDLPPMYSARYKSPHRRDFTLRLIKMALKINGFQIFNITGTCIPPFKNWLSRILSQAFPRFSSKIIILSKKIAKPKLLPETLIVWNEQQLEKLLKS
jgi:methionine biosynthesis protein MetW